MKSKVLIVEDDKKLQNVIRSYFESAGFSVMVANTLTEAEKKIAFNIPDLVILDLMLPDGSGEDFIQTIKEFGDIPVIMATAKSSENEKLLGFSLGADDYVVKPFSPRELVARAKVILKRYEKGLTKEDILSFNNGKIKINPANHEVLIDGLSIELSRTEFKLLLLLASAPGKAFSRLELVEKALGYEFEGYERTIDAHIKNLRHKIGDNPKDPCFIQTVFGLGYKFIGKKDDNHDKI